MSTTVAPAASTEPDTRTRSAVVTGLGVVAPNGLGVEEYWQATLAGRSGLRRVSRFDVESYPSSVAGEITDYEAGEQLPSRLLPQTDRMTRFALTASDWALEDAGVTPSELPEFDMGVVTAASGGGVEFGQRELQALWREGKEYVSAYQSFAWFYAVNTGQISIRQKMRGPSGVLVTEQAGGLDALGHARRHVRNGTRLVMSGGVDGALCPWGWVPQIATGLLSESADPTHAYLPFADAAQGYVPGEGGAIIVVEDEESARARDARIYGRVSGYAASLDPAPDSGRPSSLGRAVRGAVADAGLTPADIDVVFADAAGVPELDRVEAETLAEIFGPHGVPVTAPKSLTGRLFGGGAPLDVACALLALRDGVVPPTAAAVGAAAEGHRIDLVVGAPRPAELRHALVVARGYGGFNAALVVSRA